MLDILIGIAGCVIVLVTAADIFRSLLVPRANTRWLRVGPVLTIVMFSGWQAMCDRIPGVRLRQTVRASLAPLMLVLVLMIWATLLIAGFGLIFWADRADFTPGFPSLGDAFYASGSVFSTLGISGSVKGLTRLAVLICSVSGLAVVTVVATFLISIQSGFGRRETLVLRLESHVTLPPAGIAILETAVVEPPPEAKAGAHFVLRTGTRVLCDLAEQFGVGNTKADGLDGKRLSDHHARLLAAGYKLSDDQDAAVARYADRRATYAGALVGLGRRLHIDVDERKSDDIDSEPQA